MCPGFSQLEPISLSFNRYFCYPNQSLTDSEALIIFVLRSAGFESTSDFDHRLATTTNEWGRNQLWRSEQTGSAWRPSNLISTLGHLQLRKLLPSGF